MADQQWERQLLEKLAMAAVNEQKWRRRWRMFLTLAFLILVIFIVLRSGAGPSVPMVSTRHAAVVHLEGVIGMGQVNADDLYEGLKNAFKAGSSPGVILEINSPGGSAVESARMNAAIVDLKKQYRKPIYVVVDEVCASGGYYTAVAADEIYAHPSSIVGSIGVLFDGFGLVDTLKKLGIERRLITSGDRKGFMDPFSPVRPEDQEHIKKMLKEVHEEFIAKVREGRQGKLKETPEMFSGLAWTAKDAQEMGLIDGFSSARALAKEKFHTEEFVDYTKKKSWSERLMGQTASAMANALLTQAMSVQAR